MKNGKTIQDNERKIVLAICYDFDKTLSPDDMQAQGFIQSVGFNVKEFWEKSFDARLKDVALMAVSILRLAPATDFLLELVATGAEAAAESALAALALHRYDEKLRERTEAAVAKNGRIALRRLFEERFRAKA